MENVLGVAISINCMLIAPFLKILNSRYVLATTATALIISFFPFTTLAKPNDRSIKIRNAAMFDFKGCAQPDGRDEVICVGNLRSLGGEQSVSIYRSDSETSITDFKGKVYEADEIRVGDAGICDIQCSYQYFTLVEGVNYRTLFIFKNVSLPSPKIALLSINIESTHVKFRNISVVNPTKKNPVQSQNSVDETREREHLAQTVNEAARQRRAVAPEQQPQQDSNYSNPPQATEDPLTNMVKRGLNDLFRIPNQ